MSPFFNQITRYYDELSETEQEVIDFILRYEPMESLKLRDIQDELHVSSATIIRACKKLGYPTFNQLKYELAGQKKETVNPLVSANDFESILLGLQSDFQRTLELLAESRVAIFCEYIQNARRIFCVGTGSSYSAASELNLKLKLIDKWSNDYFERYSIERIPEIIAAEDVIVVFSLSGNHPEINEILLKAKQKGAAILSVTNMSHNPLQSLSDHSLSVYVSPPSRKKVRSRLMFNVAVDVVFEYLLKKMAETQ